MAKKIISIDDEPSMLTTLKNVLHSRGYEFCMTTDPDEGIRMIKEDQDLCLAMLPTPAQPTESRGNHVVANGGHIVPGQAQIQHQLQAS